MGKALAICSLLLGLAVFVVVGEGQIAWILSLMVAGVMLAVAVVVYRGIPIESELYTARGRVFVNPKNRFVSPFVASSYSEPDAIEEEGGVVKVHSRWEELEIVFRDETQRESFKSEVSSLLKAR